MTASDITDLIQDIMRHRLVLSFEAKSEHITADMILDKLIKLVPLP